MVADSIVDDDLLEAVEQALADGRRDGYNGGVAAPVVSEYVPISDSRVSKRLSELVVEGELVRVYGKAPDGYVRPSVLPSDHDDVR